MFRLNAAEGRLLASWELDRLQNAEECYVNVYLNGSFYECGYPHASAVDAYSARKARSENGIDKPIYAVRICRKTREATP